MNKTWLAPLALAAVLQTGIAQEPIEEIVVTAQKREQNILEVPFSITAISEADVENRDITNIGEIDRLVPNLQVTQAPGNSTAAQIAIRGGVTINPALTWETTVGLYLDGVYIGKTQGSVFDVVEVERIEVLRGPQGTLYGRNTLAGGINIVSKAPSGELGGYAKAGVGNYGAQTLAASLSLPAMGNVRVNLAARNETRDGWVDVNAGSIATSSVDALGDIDRTAFRAAVDVDLSDQLTLAYRFDFSEADQAATHSQLHRLDADFMLPILGFVSTEREDSASVDGPSFEKSEVSGHSLTVDLDLSETLSFKSITAFRDLTWSDGLDLDGTPLDVAHTQRYSDYESFSQELQILGGSGNLNFVAGAYLFNDDGFTDNPQRFFGVFGPFGQTFVSRYGFETQAVALFAQIDYDLSEALTLTAGLRYTDEQKEIERELGNAGQPRTISAGTQADTSFDDLTPTVSLSYDLSDSVSAYLRYAEGFKSGGFNGEAQTLEETLRPYSSESVRSIEAGVKGLWFDNRLRASAAVFHNEHSDMQLSVFTAEGAAGSSVRNAGEAVIQGIEVEGMLNVTEDIRVRASYGYLDSEYDKFLDCGGAADVANNRAFPHAPESSLSLSLEAALFRGSWGQLDVIIDHSHISDYYLYPYPIVADTNPACAASALAPATEVGDYGLTDLRLLLSDVRFGENTSFSASLWVQNLGDEEYRANMIDFG
ncbi:MAG: TonB-dependent receptor, partial [Gammaproteobacteria bacterium]|nr:TonB-dependent receptor [Gammaproteobacteria bacterium]